MDETGAYYTEWSKSERKTPIQYINAYIWNLDREGNGIPLQYSCLENPMDDRAWWAAVYGVAQSRTRLKRLSSSSSMEFREMEWWPYMWDSKRDTDVKNRLLDFVGEGDGGVIWENNIETCILSYVK